MKQKHKTYLTNLLFPAFIFGSITGVLTAAVVLLYKLCAKYVIAFSEQGYHFLRENLIYVPLVAAALLGVALLLAWLYKKTPNLQGGGIPTSIGVLRGLITFAWLRNLLGVFFLSLSTFLIGVPLGNEGPAVQMGTAIGRGSVYSLAKKHRAWDRYSMTGGACAGFSVATGAPISGMLFAIEEAHQRVSPMILIVSATSVVFANITSKLLAPVLGVSTELFPALQLHTLQVGDVWIPIVIGLFVGLFAVAFLKYFRILKAFVSEKLAGIPHFVRIFAVFAATVALGLCSFSFVSTGHELILELFVDSTPIWFLLLVLLVRSTLTLSANSAGITGGTFIPILTLGAVIASVIGKMMTALFGLGAEYETLILVLGIVACISGMMKMPLTAILFSIEALDCYANIPYVIAVVTVSFTITELFGAKSIGDHVLETRIEAQNKDKTTKVIDTFVTVQKDAFAIGKQVRDIFWPANLFVLSVKHDSAHGAEVDGHGGKELREGDILHVRYSTFDEIQSRAELIAIVGGQEYDELETDII